MARGILCLIVMLISRMLRTWTLFNILVRKSSIVAASKPTDKISSFFANNTKEDTEHNLPLNCADHVGNLLGKIFPENEMQESMAAREQKQVQLFLKLLREA